MSDKRTGVLVLLHYLMEESNEKNPLKLTDLQNKLDEEGCYSGRNTVHRYLDIIKNDWNLDLRIKRGKKSGYYIGERIFSLEQLILVIDAIQSCNVINPHESKQIVEKLQSLVSKNDRKFLKRNTQAINVAKTDENNKITQNVSAINEAINQNRQIRFYNRRWNRKKKLVKDKEHIISPWGLFWTIDRTYLYGYSKREDGSVKEIHFRVDKLADIEILDIERIGMQEFQSFEPEVYVSQRVGMFSGHTTTVRIQTTERLLGAFIDQFGAGKVQILKEIDQDWIEISFRAVISPQFLGWLLGLENVKLIDKSCITKYIPGERGERWIKLFEDSEMEIQNQMKEKSE